MREKKKGREAKEMNKKVKGKVNQESDERNREHVER